MGQMKYFHELSQEEVDKLVENETTVGFVLKNFKQPDWCNYPDALSMSMGCWSLCDLDPNGLRSKISHEYCKSCECYNK